MELKEQSMAALQVAQAGQEKDSGQALAVVELGKTEQHATEKKRNAEKEAENAKSEKSLAEFGAMSAVIAARQNAEKNPGFAIGGAIAVSDSSAARVPLPQDQGIYANGGLAPADVAVRDTVFQQSRNTTGVRFENNQAFLKSDLGQAFIDSQKKESPPLVVNGELNVELTKPEIEAHPPPTPERLAFAEKLAKIYDMPCRGPEPNELIFGKVAAEKTLDGIKHTVVECKAPDGQKEMILLPLKIEGAALGKPVTLDTGRADIRGLLDDVKNAINMARSQGSIPVSTPGICLKHAERDR